MIARMMSFATMPGPVAPSTVTRIRLGFFCQIVWVISTWATSDAPMPNA